MQSSAMGSVMSKYTSGAENKAEEKIHRKLLKEAISTKVFFWDDLLPDWGGKEEDGQTDIENLIQNIQILDNKVYMWNETVFRVMEIKFSIDPEA